jgi:hypothetical protein
MPSWVLNCPGCSKTFPHSQIKQSTMADYFVPSKPEFPEGGQNLECPNCKKAETYQRTDLRYQLDGSSDLR